MKKTISIIGIGALIAASTFLIGCQDEDKIKDSVPNKTTTNTTTMQTETPKNGEEIAVLETSMGDIKFKLFPEIAPETVKNFKELTNQKKYIDVPIHRVIDDFMIQMGDFENGNGTGGYSYNGPGTTIPDEPSPKLKHLYGAVSMAKTAAPNSGGSQFFIVENKAGTSWLDGKHTVFGQVIEGIEVVSEIAGAKTGPMDNPLEEILLKSVSIEKYEGA